MNSTNAHENSKDRVEEFKLVNMDVNNAGFKILTRKLQTAHLMDPFRNRDLPHRLLSFVKKLYLIHLYNFSNERKICICSNA